MLDPLDALKEKMVLVCKALQKQRLLDGYGHVTARLADGRNQMRIHQHFLERTDPLRA